MISDKIENWEQYFSGEVWGKVFEFISSLNSDSPEGITEIMGKKLYGRVMSYETVSPDK